MKSYEKYEGGRLHGHMLIFVLSENIDVVCRWADRFDTVRRKRDPDDKSVLKHACYAVDSDVLYASKQHQWAGPGCDGVGSSRKFYQRGDAITGTRISFTKAALGIIAKADEASRIAAIPDRIAA